MNQSVGHCVTYKYAHLFLQAASSTEDGPNDIRLLDDILPNREYSVLEICVSSSN